MSARTSNVSTRSGSTADFVIRKQQLSPWLVFTAFLVALLVCLVIAVHTLDKTPLIAFLFISFAALGGYAIIALQRSRDLILTTEFQNALFSSALDYNRTFGLIIRHDGNIVYMDRSFQRIFSDFIKEGHLSLANFLTHGKVETLAEEKIFSAVERNIGEQVVCTLYGSDGRAYKLVISIEPIHRPAGFFMLHAREYVTQRQDRAQVQNAPADANLLSKSSLTLLSAILDKMNIGVYVADTGGNVIYANSTLENWLMFKEGDIAQGSFSMADLIQHDEAKTGVVTPNDFDGECAFKKKIGGLLRARINQKVIRSEDNAVLGCMAIVSNITENNPTEKKKMW